MSTSSAASRASASLPALLLAEHGFDVEAIDGSPAGLAVVRETAAARGLPVSLHQGLADALPFPDADFDFVVPESR